LEKIIFLTRLILASKTVKHFRVNGGKNFHYTGHGDFNQALFQGGVMSVIVNMQQMAAHFILRQKEVLI